MKFFSVSLTSALVFYLGFFCSPCNAEKFNISDKSDDANQRIYNVFDANNSYGVWKIKKGSKSKNNFSALITKSTPDASGESASIIISCIKYRPGVSIIYRNAEVQKNTFDPKPIEVSLNDTSPAVYFGSALLQRNGIGVFDAQGYSLITALRDANRARITLPEQNLSWEFDLSGLGIALEMMRDRCAFSYQMRLDFDQLRSLQFRLQKLGYNVSNDGSVDDKFTSGVKKFQRINNLKITGRLDQQTLSILTDPGDIAKVNDGSDDPSDKVVSDDK